MENSPEPSEELDIIMDIALRLLNDEDVSLQDQLFFLRYREKTLSTELTAGDMRAFHPLEDIRGQIDAVNKLIVDSGAIGTESIIGRSSRDDAHNNEH